MNLFTMYFFTGVAIALVGLLAIWIQHSYLHMDDDVDGDEMTDKEETDDTNETD